MHSLPTNSLLAVIAVFVLAPAAGADIGSGSSADTWSQADFSGSAESTAYVPDVLQPQSQRGVVAAPPQSPPPHEIAVKLRKGTQAAAALARTGIEARGRGKRLAGDHELRGLLDRHGVKSSEAVFGRAKRDEAGQNTRARAGKETERDKLFRWCRLQLPDGVDPAQALADFKANPAVEYAEAVFEYQLCGGLPDASTDPNMPLQWHLDAIRAREAWIYVEEQGIPAGGNRDVVVAVIDSGVDYNHQDLIGNIWTNPGEIPGNGIDDDANGFIDDVHGCNVTSDGRSHSGDPIDLHGHGTHVAGIIAATAFNNLGGVGVAFGVQVMPIRAAQYAGVLTTTDISEAIIYGVDNGAEVINMSFGGYASSQIVEEALAMALHQAVLVAAAGNDGIYAKIPPYIKHSPAAYPFVLGVAATDSFGFKIPESNWGYERQDQGRPAASSRHRRRYSRAGSKAPGHDI